MVKTILFLIFLQSQALGESIFNLKKICNVIGIRAHGLRKNYYD